MPLVVRCPKCKGSITIEASQTKIECPHCAAKIRRDPRPKPAVAPVASVAAVVATGQAPPVPAASSDVSLDDLVPLEPDLVPLAPEPAPGPVSKAPISPSPKFAANPPKDRPADEAPKPARTNMLVAGIGTGIGVLVFVVGFAVAGALFYNWSSQAAKALVEQAGAGTSEKPGGTSDSPVQVFDQPLPDVAPAKQADEKPTPAVATGPAGPQVIVPQAQNAEPKPLFVAAPKFDSQAALRREPTTNFPKADASAAAEGAADLEPARWSIPADPAPTAEPVAYAADLRIPLNQCAAYEGPRMYPPVLADLNGPFAAFAPAWEGPVFESKVKIATKGPAKTTITLVPKPSATVPVVDLRTGKQAGEFDFRAPIARNPVLSPDAAYLVGPDAVPDQIAQVAHAELFVLFVWKQGAEKPTAKLKVPGSVAWLGFFSNDHLAVITYDGKPLVQIWDVAKGKLEKSIYLTAEQLIVPSLARELEGLDRRVNAFYHRQQASAGVSPGGRYLVVGGKSTATVVDLTEGREIGTVPVNLQDNHINSYRGMSFSPDGKEFTVWTFTRLPTQEAGQAETYSLTEGKKLRRLVSTTLSPGPLVPGPAPDIVVATGAQFGGVGTYSTAIDVESGRAAFQLPAILRWSPSGPVVAIGRLPEPGKPAPEGADAFLGAGEGAFGVYSIPDAHSRILAGCGLTEHGLPKRPKLTEADRSGVQKLAHQAPANWSALPEVKPLVSPAENNLLGPTEWPAAFGDTRAASLRMSVKEKKQGLSSIRYYETRWDQFDLVSGKPAAEPIVVAPWAVKPGSYPQRQYLAALTADGQMLAMDDLETPGRIDVWSADGKHVVAFLPYGVPTEGADLRGTKAVIEWLGWSSDGRLLTLADGKLTAWDIPAAKAVWEIDGGYTVPMEFAPGRTWLAASTVSSMDLLDPATGTLVNRCAVGAAGKITDIAHSADGGQMAALYVQQSDVADSFNERKVVPEGGDAIIALWDLKSGEARVTQSERIQRFAFLHWGSNEHLALCGPVTRVLDLRLDIAPIQVMFPYTNPFPERGFPLNRGPDGRVWAAVLVASPTPTDRHYCWRPHAVPDFQGEKEGPYVAADRQYFDASKAKVRFECSVGDPELGKRAGEAVIKSLQTEGFQIGPGDWVLRVTHQVTDTGNTFMNGQQIPKIDYQWELKDAKGTLIWKDRSEGTFAGQSSKYFRPSTWKERNEPREFGTTVEYFEFGTKKPREAIIEEIRERGSGVVGLHHKIPTRFFTSGGKFLEQPISVAFNVEPPTKDESPAVAESPPK